MLSHTRGSINIQSHLRPRLGVRHRCPAFLLFVPLQLSNPPGHILTLYLLRLHCAKPAAAVVTSLEWSHRGEKLPPARAAALAILATPPHHHQHNVNKYRQQILFCDKIFLDIICLDYFYAYILTVMTELRKQENIVVSRQKTH